ncbi:hypothetical protein [Streptomyces filamentosus]|uniref:hypothetical protein n=1 Tax=Streptomyces filamentosus TaxID=67294 RepID=UPI00123896BE|nr:hypothetical protein [Streptomyces filamentosus]KAA6220030.1 hypothetical protein CP979_26395 [Streptomyces filamentosus]
MSEPIGQNFTDDGREVVHYAELHRPTLYRYAVADPGLRLTRNRYGNQFSAVTIGLALIVGRHAYCVKWAHGRVRFV